MFWKKLWICCRKGLREPKQIAYHAAIVLKHKAGLRLDVCIVACEVVGEEFTIFENRVDRLAKKSRLATEKADRVAIA